MSTLTISNRSLFFIDFSNSYPGVHKSEVIDVAKEKIFDHNKSVSEIAYELGFKYPQHFTRLFKQKVGFSPNEFRLMN